MAKKERDLAGAKKGKKQTKEGMDMRKRFLPVIMFVGLSAIIMFGCSSESGTSNTAPVEPPVIEEPSVAETGTKEFAVTLLASGHFDGNGIVFDIETNLPDETVLMLTLSNGNYNTDSAYTAQTKVTVENGKASSDPFSAKGEKLSGDFDLSVSMSLPSLQSDAVREVIGEAGEYMMGPLVGDSNTIKAIFNVSIGDDISITASSDYENTVFREELGDESSNAEFVSNHESDAIVAAKLVLDNFISDYRMSLAPQNWTVDMFDDTGNTVIAVTDITYNGETGKYIYVGTLNVSDSGTVDSATPHYVEVNGVILGNDGYCDDSSDLISSYR